MSLVAMKSDRIKCKLMCSKTDYSVIMWSSDVASSDESVRSPLMG